MIVIWVGLLIANASNTCDTRCQATNEINKLIAEAQNTAFEKRDVYEIANKEHIEAEKELLRLFKENREFIDNWDMDFWSFTQHQPQVQKLGVKR